MPARLAHLVPLLLLLGALPLIGVGACGPQRGDDDTEEDDDDAVDDDDSAVDDDDASDDDDFTFEDPPVFLASYDFSLVFLENAIAGDYSAVHGQMDVSVSTTAFLAEMVTTDGQEWAWGGTLDQNAQQFLVRGWMTPPSVGKEIYVEVTGNFLADVDGTPSESCLTGIGKDDDPNYPDQGIEFAWYGCQLDATAPAIDRSGSHPVTVTVHGDECGGWSGTTSWTENWQFDGRRLLVTRNAYTGYGIVSDDGNIFRFTMLENANPGRTLKVVGDFTNPTGTTEARATGYCHNNPTDFAGAVIDLDY